MNHPLGEPTRFVSRPAAITEEFEGASLITLHVSDEVDKILGSFNWGEATGYLLRRFGPPNMPCSEDEIAKWIITTPMDGLYLTIRSIPSGPRYLFGWITTTEQFTLILKAKQAQERKWITAFSDWCQRTHGRLPFTWQRNDENISAEDPKKREQDRDEFHSWKAAFDLTEPVTHDDDLFFTAQRAIVRTLHDLKRTVSVRDSDISIHGSAQSRLGHVKASPLGGAYVPAIAFTEEMHEIYGAIHRLGGGKKGLKALIARAKIEEIP